MAQDATTDPADGDANAQGLPDTSASGGSDANANGDEPKVFDQEYVSKLRAEAAGWRTKAKEVDKYKKQLDEIEDSKKSDLERAEKRAAEAEQKASELEARDLRRTVAAKHKLPADFADRLRGNDEEQLEADAKALAELLEKQRGDSPRAPRIPPGPKDSGGGGNNAMDQWLRAARR